MICLYLFSDIPSPFPISIHFSLVGLAFGSLNSSHDGVELPSAARPSHFTRNGIKVLPMLPIRPVLLKRGIRLHHPLVCCTVFLSLSDCIARTFFLK